MKLIERKREGEPVNALIGWEVFHTFSYNRGIDFGDGWIIRITLRIPKFWKLQRNKTIK